MSRFLGGLVKAALGVGVVYAAYKIGEDRGKKGKEEELSAERDNLLMENLALIPSWLSLILNLCLIISLRFVIKTRFTEMTLSLKI